MSLKLKSTYLIKIKSIKFYYNYILMNPLL